MEIEPEKSGQNKRKKQARQPDFAVLCFCQQREDRVQSERCVGGRPADVDGLNPQPEQSGGRDRETAPARGEKLNIKDRPKAGARSAVRAPKRRRGNQQREAETAGE